MTKPHQSDLTQAGQEIPVTCCGIEWHRTKVNMTGGSILHISHCLICKRQRPIPVPTVQMSEREKGADRLRLAFCLRMGEESFDAPKWNFVLPAEQLDWLSVYDHAKDMFAPKCDRDGLAKALAVPMFGRGGCGNSGQCEAACEKVADAAVAYMGARPVDTSATNWELAYDKACRERDEQRACIDEAVAVLKLP